LKNFRQNRQNVIPDAQRDRESRAKPALLDRRWIPDQAFGLSGMTGPANNSAGNFMRGVNASDNSGAPFRGDARGLQDNYRSSPNVRAARHV
jgi:hypothetical protein